MTSQNVYQIPMVFCSSFYPTPVKPIGRIIVLAVCVCSIVTPKLLNYLNKRGVNKNILITQIVLTTYILTNFYVVKLSFFKHLE